MSVWAQSEKVSPAAGLFKTHAETESPLSRFELLQEVQETSLAVYFIFHQLIPPPSLIFS